MSRCKESQTVEFKLEGQLLGFLLEDGYKFKYLLLANSTGEHSIKLSAEARSSLGSTILKPGDWLRITGTKKQKYDEIKLKAYEIALISAKDATIPQIEEPAQPKKSNILICQKSDCKARGGKALCQAMEAALSDRGLETQVAIKGTGCMKQCKAGPNLVMPDKTRYSRIQADQVPRLMHKHFPIPRDHN